MSALRPALDDYPAGHFAPPTPERAPPGLSWRALLVLARTNAIRMWSDEAYVAPFALSRFLGRTRVLLSDPAGIRHVLVDNHANYIRTAATIRVLRPIVGDGLFLAEGEAWRHQRRTLAPAFAPRALGVMLPHVARGAARAVERLHRECGGPVDLLAAVQHLTLEIAGRAMFSLDIAGEGQRLREAVDGYSRRLGRPYLLDFLLPLAVPSPHDIARHWFRRRWLAFMDGLVARRLAEPRDDTRPRDLLDLMQAARDPETGRGFSPAEIRNQLATMLVAGHETTALALFWSLSLLAAVPEWQERVAAEAAAAPLAPGSEEAALAALPATRAVLDETLRLYPPAFAIIRAAREDDTVAGVPIRAGTLVIIAPWVLHRHRRLWQDPDVFDPRRFLPGAPPPERFAYLPFGAGPRVCIGVPLALGEATLVLASLVRAFRIALPDGPPPLPLAVITTRPDRAPGFRLEPR